MVGESVPQRTASGAYSAMIWSESFRPRVSPHFIVATATSSFGPAKALVITKMTEPVTTNGSSAHDHSPALTSEDRNAPAAACRLPVGGRLAHRVTKHPC